MPKDERYDFNFGEAIKEDGLEFVRLGESGRPIVRDTATGDESEFDLDGMVGSMGVSKDQVDVIYNTKDNPVNISPLSFNDRAKVKAFGNVKGSMKFLRNKFEDVFPHEEKGLLVKNKGVWHQIDASGLGGGDMGDKAWELAKDIADNADIGLNALIAGKGATSGAIKGAAVGATAGSIIPGVGTAIGGAVGGVLGGLTGALAGGTVSGKIRTSLGRFFGTYDATPEEELRDIGLEGIYTMGGQLIGAGARPTIQALMKAGRNIGKSAIKEPVIGIYGRLTGVGNGAMRELLENGDGVARAMKTVAGQAGKGATGETAVNLAADKAIANADELFKVADEGLSRKYGDLLNNIFKGAEKRKMNVNMRKVVDTSFKDIEDAGLGFIENLGNPKLKPKFIPLSESARVARIQGGLDAPVLEKGAIKQINSLVRELDGFGQTGVLKGRVAASRLTALNKRLNSLSRKTFQGQSASQEYKAAVAKATGGFRNEVQSEMGKVGLGKKYVDMQLTYNKFANSVQQARKLKDATGGAERFVQRLSSDSGANRTQAGIAKDLVEIAGPRGQQLFKSMSEYHAASKFSSWLPKMGLLQFGVLGGGAGAAVSGGMAITPGSAAAISQFSPKFVAKQIRGMQYAGKGLNWLKSLPPQQLKQFTSNPEAFRAWSGAIMSGMQREEQNEQQILQGVGLGKQ